MQATFIESSIFEKLRANYLSDEAYHWLQLELLADPKLGDVIQGTGGLRKIRVAGSGKGKRGGSRVIYYHFDEKQRFYLLTIYAKNEVSDLTSEQRRILMSFMEAWRNEQT